MRIKKIFFIVKTDIIEGIIKRWYFYVVLIMIISSFCALLNYQTDELNSIYLSDFKPTITDYWLHLFKGMQIYIPTPTSKFELPIIWLMLNLYLAIIIAKYPTTDLYGFGKYILMQSKDRSNWFLGKCIWTVICVLFFYFLLYITTFVFAFFSGNLSFEITNEICSEILKYNFIAFNITSILLYVLFLPVTTSIALCIIQLILELVLKPIYSFLIIVSILVASAYFYTPFLIGNASMMLRSSLVLDNGLNGFYSFTIDIIITIMAIVSGCVYFKRIDILDKE